MKKLILLLMLLPMVVLGQDKKEDDNKVLVHLVFVKFKENVSVEKFKDIAYEYLVPIPGVHDFQFSENVSPEGYERGFLHAFSMSFKTQEDRDKGYLPHPMHVEFGAKYWNEYVADWMVYDYWKEAPTLKENPYELVWADEFDNEGLPDPDKWFLETFAPENGSWFNNELQHYTDRIDNATVSEGTLKIIAKKELFESSGSTKEFTSARFNSKLHFTYGKVEVRAKLPRTQGTWPAIWALGTNLPEVGWPVCGEIDIMEQLFENHLMVQSALHVGGRYGDDPALKQLTVTDVTENFHVYGMVWTEQKIDFTVDGEVFFTYQPEDRSNDFWPFYKDQYLLLNVAVGGSLGGAVDPNFTQDQMEVDYVRVYQKK
jgi:beta-glucanase (GH16 family)